MGLHIFKDKRIEVKLCIPNIYEYKGCLFELHPGSGPICLKKDWESAKRVSKGFWDIVTEFCNLPKSKQKKYLVMS